MTAPKRHRVGLPSYTKGRPSLASRFTFRISTHEHNHDNVYDEITSQSMYKIYLGHVSFFFKTTTNLPRSLTADAQTFWKGAQYPHNLTFKRRLHNICQYKRMWHLPTIRSKKGTDQYSISLNVIQKRPPLRKIF